MNTLDHIKAALLANKHPVLHAQLPNPDEATAMALADILDPSSNVMPAGLFEELTRRNRALVNAPRGEIIDTLARQIALLEAVAIRNFHKAAITTSPSASVEFTKAALATNRVLLQALSAVYQMNQDRNQAPALQGGNHADES